MKEIQINSKQLKDVLADLKFLDQHATKMILRSINDKGIASTADLVTQFRGELTPTTISNTLSELTKMNLLTKDWKDVSVNYFINYLQVQTLNDFFEEFQMKTTLW